MMSLNRRTIRLAAALLAATAPTLAEGQATDSVRLEGRVLEAESQQPIGLVDVILFDRDQRRIGRVETDRQGNFSARVSSTYQGVYLEAARIGYESNRMPFLWFDGHSFFELEIRLDPEAILLAPLEVVARSKSENPVLRGFRQRVRQGLGHYITREQIEQAKAQRVTDLLTRVPGVELRASGNGLRRVVQMGRKAILSCPAQIYVDGMRLNPTPRSRGAGMVAIDDYVSPSSVEGIEVYRGMATIPAAFMDEHADCGVVVIWTRRGG